MGRGDQIVAVFHHKKVYICRNQNDVVMKRLPVLLLILLLAWFTSSRAQQVQVTNNIPETCRSGDRCVVELVIQKSGVEGFARIQQTLPDGFTAEVVSDGGSDFIFDKQRVSFIWLSLPAGNVVKVSYRLIFAASVKGKFEMGEGTFSYLQENKLQKLAIEPQTFWANMKPEVANNPQPVAPPVVNEVPKVVAQRPVQDQPVTEPQPVTEAQPQKTEEPKALELKPVKEQIPEPKPVTPSEPPVKAEPGVVEKPVVKEEPQKPVQPEVKEEPKPTPQPPAKVEPKAPEPKLVAREVLADPKPVAPANTKGTSFRVQFAALKTQRDTESLRKQFNITEQVFLESADGWHRYTFGPFASQAEAEAARKAFVARNGGNPMVIRYQDGKRAQ